MKFEIQTLTHADLPKLKALLAANNLPHSDIESENRTFLGAWDNDKLLGAIGIEHYGNSGLLRSLVVDKACRNNNIATALHSTLIENCITNGLEKLYLLTQTAEVFFEKKGWKVITRESVPTAVKTSSEFAHLCPASAICMEFNLFTDYSRNVFKSGMNCSQSALLPFALQHGMKRETALRLTTGFGAGMVYRGETCGAITGCMMALGLFSGRTQAEDTDSRDLTYMLINLLYKNFTEVHGSITCQKLLNLQDTSAESWEKAGQEGAFSNKCPLFVHDAVEITQQIISKYSKTL